MNTYIKALEGISYLEWIKLRAGIDMEFERRKGERFYSFTIWMKKC